MPMFAVMKRRDPMLSLDKKAITVNLQKWIQLYYTLKQNPKKITPGN